jgi:hypothetical protein
VRGSTRDARSTRGGAGDDGATQGWARDGRATRGSKTLRLHVAARETPGLRRRL